VTLNKNTKAGDDSAVHPTAIRLGTTWMTQQGWGPEEFRRLGHIISRVLKGMHVYHYHGARKPRGRAKVDVMLFEQTKREVEQLLRDTSVLKADQVHSGYPHYFRIPGKETGEPLPLIQGRTGKAEGLIAVDATEHGIVRVTGARARLFVQGAVTADVWRLRPHQSARAYVLDRDGRSRPHHVGMALQPGDRLLTEARSQAELSVNAFSRIDCDDFSELTMDRIGIEEEGRRTVEAYQKSGVCWYKIVYAERAERFKSAAPFAVVTVSGTGADFMIDAKPEQTQVHCLEGLVLVERPGTRAVTGPFLCRGPLPV
jgi:hypothetical protein